MRIPRIYVDSHMDTLQPLLITDNAAHHIQHVLRLKTGAKVILFNGQGGEYLADIIQMKKNEVNVTILEHQPKNTESSLHIHLGQAISRGEKMEYTIQKAVELGVTEITPLFTERCGVKLAEQRLEKRLDRWRSIIINASEQSGRTQIATLNPAIKLEHWLKARQDKLRITLDPEAEQSLSSLKFANESVALLIGPEGGLADEEITLAAQHDFTGVRLGPRILRTETAALTVVSILQHQWGDLG